MIKLYDHRWVDPHELVGMQIDTYTPSILSHKEKKSYKITFEMRQGFKVYKDTETLEEAEALAESVVRQQRRATAL